MYIDVDVVLSPLLEIYSIKLTRFKPNVHCTLQLTNAENIAVT